MRKPNYQIVTQPIHQLIQLAEKNNSI